MLAPWLSHIPDYLGAASRGASLGLDLRRTEDANQEASARLRLNYTQLGMHQQESMARLAAGQQAQSYAAAERLMEQDALERWRQSSELHQREQEKIAGSRLAFDERQAATKALAPNALKAYHVGEKLISIGPDGTAQTLFDAGSNKVDPLDAAKYRAALQARTAAGRDLSDPVKSAVGKGSLQTIISNSDAAIADIEKKYAPKVAPSAALRPGKIFMGRTQDEPAVGLPQAATLYPQGGTMVLDKKTGKRFIYKGNPSDIPRDQYDILGQ